MKNKNLSILLIILLVIILFLSIILNKKIDELRKSNEFKKELVIAYEGYFDATEAFLDTLDNHYDWVDAFDPEEYYTSVEKLDSLYKTQL